VPGGNSEPGNPPGGAVAGVPGTVAVAEGVGVGVGAFAEVVGAGVGDFVGVGVGVGGFVGEAVGDGVTYTGVAVAVGRGEGVGLGDAVALGEAVGVGVALGVAVGETVDTGLDVWTGVALDDGELVAPAALPVGCGEPPTRGSDVNPPQPASRQVSRNAPSARRCIDLPLQKLAEHERRRQHAFPIEDVLVDYFAG